MREILGGAVVLMVLSGCAKTASIPEIEPVSARASEPPVLAAPSAPSPPVLAAPSPPSRPGFVRARSIRPAPRSTKTQLSSQKRPVAGDPISVDFEALPLAEALSGAHERTAFSLRRLDLTAKSCPMGMGSSERITWATDLSASEPKVVRIGNITLPSAGLLDGAHSDYALEPLAAKAILPAGWVVLSGARAHDGMDVVDFRGAFDTATGRGLATSLARARATAIVDGVLYAFRRCVAHCDAPVGSPSRREELALIGPPAVWTGSTDETDKQALDRRTPFTRVTAPLEIGSSATLELVAFDGDIARFEKGLAPMGLPTDRTDETWTTYSLDVVWPLGNEKPSLNLFVAHSDGDPTTIRPDIASLYAEPEPSPRSYCYPMPPPRPDRELIPEFEQR